MDAKSGGHVQKRRLSEPYSIPLRSLYSKNISNLMFAGRCVSCDNEVLAAIRVMPQCMNMGEAAGVGAAIALEDNVSPCEVDVSKVRSALLDGGAILSMDQVYIHEEDK